MSMSQLKFNLKSEKMNQMENANHNGINEKMKENFWTSF